MNENTKSSNKIVRADNQLNEADAILNASRQSINELLATVSDLIRDDLTRHESEMSLDEIGRSADIVCKLSQTMLRQQSYRHRAVEFEEKRAQPRAPALQVGLTPEMRAKIERTHDLTKDD